MCVVLPYFRMIFHTQQQLTHFIRRHHISFKCQLQPQFPCLNFIEESAHILYIISLNFILRFSHTRQFTTQLSCDVSENLSVSSIFFPHSSFFSHFLIKKKERHLRRLVFSNLLSMRRAWKSFFWGKLRDWKIPKDWLTWGWTEIRAKRNRRQKKKIDKADN